mgnify:CR=1 FL=1
MAKKKKCPECPAGERWAVPYADFLSLLLALFIALYAISSQNKDKLKALGAVGVVEVGNGIQAIFGAKADAYRHEINRILGRN